MLSKRIPHCFAHEALPLFNSKLLLKQIFYSKHTRKKQTATRRRYSRTWHHEITKESFTLIKNVDQHQWTMKWQLNFCTTGECWENLITDNFGENKAVLKDSVNLRHHAYLTLHCENENNGPNWNNSSTRFFCVKARKALMPIALKLIWYRVLRDTNSQTPLASLHEQDLILRSYTAMESLQGI